MLRGGGAFTLFPNAGSLGGVQKGGPSYLRTKKTFTGRGTSQESSDVPTLGLGHGGRGGTTEGTDQKKIRSDSGAGELCGCFLPRFI